MENESVFNEVIKSIRLSEVSSGRKTAIFSILFIFLFFGGILVLATLSGTNTIDPSSLTPTPVLHSFEGEYQNQPRVAGASTSREQYGPANPPASSLKTPTSKPTLTSDPVAASPTPTPTPSTSSEPTVTSTSPTLIPAQPEITQTPTPSPSESPTPDLSITPTPSPT